MCWLDAPHPASEVPLYHAGAAKMTQERAAQSGAAASSAALAQAIRAMSLLLCATLGDRDTPPGRAAMHNRRREPHLAASSAEALSALEALAVGSSAAAEQQMSAEESVSPAAQAQGTLGKYDVTRNAAWVDSTLQHLVPLLERVLPPLCSHHQPSVREALAKGENRILSKKSDVQASSIGAFGYATQPRLCLAQAPYLH